MKGDLVIQISGDQENLKWFLEGDEGSAASSSKESLAERSWSNFKGGVRIFVPAADVYLTEAKLPILSQNKLLKMVPFAIEDEVSSPISECHFAIDGADNSGKTPIAVVDLERMKAWLQLIPEALRSQIKVMIPDVLGLPWEPGTLTLAEMGQQVLVRQDVNKGFAIEKDNVLEIIAQYMRENNHKIEKILLVSARGSSDLENAIKNELGLPLTHQPLRGEWISFLSRGNGYSPSLNLLQGPFQSTYSLQGVPRLKRIFAFMVVGWLAALAGLGFIEYGVLSFQSYRLNTELAALYNQIFPGEASSLSSKQRVEAALVSVKKAREQSAFLRLVALVSPSLRNTSGLSVQSASFSNKSLDVQVEVRDFQLLDKVTSDLRKKGLRVEQQRATKVGNVIQSHLLIKEA